MHYLVTFTKLDNGTEHTPFFTNWFQVENHFDERLGMVVYDLINFVYMDKDMEWKRIETDHL
jgi:hypothetical protein